MEEEGEIIVPRKRKRTSEIWKAFEEGEEGESRTCKTCHHKFSHRTSTTSLKKHFEKCNKSTPTPEESIPLKNRIANWIVKDLQSFKVVDSQSFRRMFEEENIPSRNSIKKEIELQYSKMREGLSLLK